MTSEAKSKVSDQTSEVRSDLAPCHRSIQGNFPISHAPCMLQPGQSGGPLLVADDVLHDGRGQGNLAQLGREALDQLKNQNEDCSEDLIKIK